VKNLAIAVAGNSGSGKTTLTKVMKDYLNNCTILECDRYHKWERDDSNWEKYTHLNTAANNIDLMFADVKKLTDNQSVLQVNYNHSNGKFTKKEEIVPQDFIIVCGLHSFYHEHDDPYFLKIYMDTDEELQTSWKLIRDKKKRGYTYKQVIEQMERRGEDYKNFVLPQKENADISVGFFRNKKNKMSYSLKVELSKDINIHKIENLFYEKNIELLIKQENEKNVMFFGDYKKLDGYTKYNNFYDYVFLIIESVIDDRT
jgi:phosphoribulokinase